MRGIGGLVMTTFTVRPAGAALKLEKLCERTPLLVAP
jgi:hypothetical protein